MTAFTRSRAFAMSASASSVRALYSRRFIALASCAVVAAPFAAARPARARATLAADAPSARLALNGRRLVAIGDLHGDFLALVKAFKLAGVLADDGAWCGGSTVVVQVGDVLDRGDDELACVRKLKQLAKQARAQGGDVIVMNGNHEIMNVMGDFRYATPGAFEECRRYAEKKRARAAARGELDASDDARDEDDEMAGVRARQALFRPGGEFARWFAKNPTVLVVDGTVFAHAGVDASHAEYGFDRINREVMEWMQGKTKMPPKQVLESDGVVWTRDYGGKDAGNPAGNDAKFCRRLEEALEAADAKRLVVGHTPQTTGVNSGCKGTVWRVDVGASRGIYGGTVQVLEIVNGRVRVLA